MSSVSEQSDALPQNAPAIERALRQVVLTARKNGTIETLTINIARTAAEQKLGLAAGFLKSHSQWKDRSKDVVKAALEQEPEDDEEDEDEDEESPPPKAVKKQKVPPATKQGMKRSSTGNATKPPKRQKRIASDDESEDFPEPEKKPAVKATRPKKAKQVVDSYDDEDRLSDPQNEEEAGESTKKPKMEEDEEEKMPSAGKSEPDSESELSEVLDEPPARRKGRQKDKPAAKAKTTSKTSSKSSKSSTAKDKDLTPDEAEVKRLQGWLIKCGIRKLWHRELASYDSSKAKIKHLKDMLKDAGMDGRYSVEKASAIKEQRELAADIEAVKEGNKQWGHDPGSDEEAEERPAKRRAAASRLVDFGDDGEDSD